MPSPSASEVTMGGESTDWLIAPRTTHIVQRSTMNSATVMIDGKFTFRVKRPKDATEGKPFSVNDAFQLRGHMSGIDRPVPGFHSPQKVKLEHPVEMSTPKFLRCLTVGQEAIFSWKVHIPTFEVNCRLRTRVLRISGPEVRRADKSSLPLLKPATPL
jgi:hypothetical protein